MPCAIMVSATLGSEGAKAVHRRPEYRAQFLAARFDRAARAEETKAKRRAEGYYDRRGPRLEAAAARSDAVQPPPLPLIRRANNE